jgi:hypothetical protein
MSSGLRRLAQSGGLVAAAIALKYPLIAIPNVEPLTLVFFALGYTHGPLWGAFVGATGEAIYTTLNPLGAPMAPVWLAQVAGMGFAGIIGGLTGSLVRRIPAARWRMFWSTVAGVLATLIFDLLTNLAFAWSIGPFWVVLASSLPFAAIHIVSNALLFAAVFPILERWLLRTARPLVEPRVS